MWVSAEAVARGSRPTLCGAAVPSLWSPAGVAEEGRAVADCRLAYIKGAPLTGVWWLQRHTPAGVPGPLRRPACHLEGGGLAACGHLEGLDLCTVISGAPCHALCPLGSLDQVVEDQRSSRGYWPQQLCASPRFRVSLNITCGAQGGLSRGVWCATVGNGTPDFGSDPAGLS